MPFVTAGHRAFHLFLGALALAIILLVGPCLLGSETIFYCDTSLHELQMHLWNAHAFADGHLPQWAPYLHLGLPHLANPTTAVFYPLTWLDALVPVLWAINLRFALHLWLAGALTWLLARRMGATPAGAALAGLGFALSGPLLSYHNNPVFGASMAWVPLALYAWLGVLGAAPLLRSALLCAVALTAELLAGDPQAVFCTGLWLAAWTLPHLASSEDRPALLRRLGQGSVVAFGLFGLLAAVQWLPSWQFLSASVRSAGGTASDTRTWSLHPARLLTLLFPNLFGTTLPDLSLWRFAWASDNRFWFFSLYAGTLPVALLLFGRRLSSWRRAASALLMFLALAMGHHLGLLDMLANLPGFALFRYPEKYALHASLALALMAGLALGPALQRPRSLLGVLASLAGLGALLALATPLFLPLVRAGSPVPNAAAALEAIRTSGLTVLLAGGLGSLIAWLLHRERLAAGRAALLLVAVTAGDLLVVHAPMVVTAPAALFSEAGPVATALRANAAPGPFRIARDTRLDGGQLHRDRQGLVLDTLHRRLSVDSAVAVQAGIETVSGYSAALLDYRLDLNRTLFSDIAKWSVLLNIRYLLLPAHAPSNRIDRALASGTLRETTIGSAFGVRVLEVSAPGQRVFCETEAGQPPPTTCHMTAWSAEHVAAEVDSPAPLRLVHSATLAPGWQAEVDGKPAPMKRVHEHLGGLDLSAGRHTVELRYEAPGLRMGARLSMLGLVLGLALGLVTLRRKPVAAAPGSGDRA